MKSKTTFQTILFNYSPFALGLFIGVYFFIFAVIGESLSYFPGDLGDGRFNNYILEHCHLFFTGKVKSFWDAAFMYPEPQVISYSDNLLGTAPIYSLLRILGNDRETSYQLWFLILSILNYASAYFFLKWLTKNSFSAVLGALVFAFSIALQSQMTHAQTFPRFPIPLAIWMVLLFIKDLKPKHFFWAVFFLVYQLYCALYLGFLLFVPIAAILIAAYFNEKERFNDYFKNRNWLKRIFIYSAINVFILLPLFWPYIIRAMNSGYPKYEKIVHSIPTFRSYFFSQWGSKLWNFLSKTADDLPAWWDHQIFPGGLAMLSAIIILIIICYRLIKQKKITKNKLHFAILVSAIITFFFFIRYKIVSFYYLLFFVPGFGSMRSLTRIINVELIFLAIATALISRKILQKKNLITYLTFICLLALFTLDNYFNPNHIYKTEKAVAQEKVIQLKEKLKNIPSGAVFSYEPDSMAEPPHIYQISAMIAAQDLGLKTVNAYTATSPGEYTTFWHNLNEIGRKEWLEYMNYNSDTVYVVH